MKSAPLLVQIRAARLPMPELEARFHPSRAWRADFLWTKPRRVIVELDGGTYIGGRHVRGRGYEADCEKLNEAALSGFLVLRVTPRMVRSGQAVTWLERALEEGKTP